MHPIGSLTLIRSNECQGQVNLKRAKRNQRKNKIDVTRHEIQLRSSKIHQSRSKIKMRKSRGKTEETKQYIEIRSTNELGSLRMFLHKTI